MIAKEVEVCCKKCNEPIKLDLNTCDFSTEVSIVNGKKEERRTFLQECPHCGQLNTYTSENKEEWGDRKGPNVKTIMFTGGFSCLATVVIAIVVGFFAVKGIMTIFDWLF